MKFTKGASLALLAAGTATSAYAGGIERTPQSAMILFAEGDRVELSFGSANPSLSGTDLAGNATGNVAKDFTLPSVALKMDVSERVSVAMIYDRPFGADIEYDYAGASQQQPALLAGTAAEAEVNALTLLAKYQATDRFSVFGGLRFQQATGEITLGGAAYGQISGYNVSLDNGSGTGYVLGAAYEIPDIALRVALTYNSAIEHDFDTVENFAPQSTTSTKTKTPESWNLEFQTGVAADTLVMGSIRYVKHSQFQVQPDWFSQNVNPEGLVSLEDTTTYTLGIGRRFTPKLAGSVMVGYEKEGDTIVSPLAPSTGRTSLSLGLSYKVTDQMELSGGVSKIWLGDANASPGGNPVAPFEDNDVTAVGFKIAYTF